jgi:hypothetical protein
MVTQRSECLLSKHDLLVHTVIKLTSSISESDSPFAKNGLLKSELGYRSEIDVFRDNDDIIFGKHFHPPDVFLVHPQKNICVTVECKSAVDEGDSKLEEQVHFYAHDQSFKKVFLADHNLNEILVVCCKNFSKQAAQIADDALIDTNCVVWQVEETPYDHLRVQKAYGEHLHDSELNELMTKGITVPPPTNLFLLINPHASVQHVTAEVAKRLFIHSLTTPSKLLNVDEFIETQRQSDCVISRKRMKDAVRYTFRIIGELGELADENRTIRFKARRSEAVIHEIMRKRAQICGSGKESFERLLTEASKPKRRPRKKMSRDQTTFDIWVK